MTDIGNIGPGYNDYKDENLDCFVVNKERYCKGEHMRTILV